VSDQTAITVANATTPTWNTAGRPDTPKAGTVGFNIQTNSVEIKTITGWYRLPMKRI
jgi:hypothetical protein